MKVKKIKNSILAGLLALSVALPLSLAFQSTSFAEQNFYELTVRKSITAAKASFSGNVFTRAVFTKKQGAVTAETGAATITIADMLTGVVTITQSTGATVALTTDTGALIQSGLPTDFAINDSFEFTVINLSAAAVDTATITAGASGVTIVGAVIVPSAHSTTIVNSSKTYRVRKTAANTFVIYALS